MSEWKEYTLEQACEKIYSGGTPSTKKDEYWNGNISWLSSGETSQRFVYDTDRKITQEGVKNSSTKLASKGCTVIATAGQGYTRGQASFLMIDTYMNQSVIACKANESIVLPLYLYYNLDSRYEEFRLLSDGTSTRGSLSGWILRRMRIKLPSLSLQKKIVKILFSIDEKIEINNKINNNLAAYMLIFETSISQDISFGKRVSLNAVSLIISLLLVSHLFIKGFTKSSNFKRESLSGTNILTFFKSPCVISGCVEPRFMAA